MPICMFVQQIGVCRTGFSLLFFRLPLTRCGSLVETSAKQKHRPSRQARLSCRTKVRLRERFSKHISLSLPPSLAMLVPPPSSEGGVTIATQFRRFILCTLRFALIIHPDKFNFVGVCRGLCTIVYQFPKNA